MTSKGADPSKPKNNDSSAPKPKRDGDEAGDRPGRDRPQDHGGAKPDKAPSKPDRQDKKPDRQDKKDREKKRDEESKEERLRKIVARVQPKVKKLVDRGVLGRLLRTALSGMRLWYRLSSLNSTGSPDFQITAVLNPRRDVQKGWVLTGNDLRRLVDQVSEEILQRPDVQEAARRMRLTKARLGADADEYPLEVSPPSDIPGAVRYLQNRGTALDVSRPGGGTRALPPYNPREGRGRPGGPTPGAMEPYVVGPDRGTAVEENRRGLTNALTQGVDTYPKIFLALASMRRRHTDPEIAHALRQYSKTGRFPRSFDAAERELLKDLHWLVFVRESVRDRGNLGYAPMMVQLIERGAMTWGDAFTGLEGPTGRRGGRGLFPMSMKVAAGTARQIAARVRNRRGRLSAAELNRRELARRQFELAENWMRAVTNGQGIYGSTPTQAINNGRDLIRRFMLKYYGLH